MDRLAIVVPCYNEEEVFPETAKRLTALLKDLIQKGKIAEDSFALFVNDEALMHFAYQRYLENQLRKAFGFSGTPIRFALRERAKENG